MATIFSDFLTALGVPHTTAYSDRAFASMPFKSLFGFTRQLKDYGIDSVGARWDDKSVLPTIPTPFMAQMAIGAFVIVEQIRADGTVRYRCPHKGECVRSTDEFAGRWSGVALLAYPSGASREPDLAAHRFADITAIAKKWLLTAAVAVLIGAGVIAAGLWTSLPKLCLLLVDFAGIGVTWLLILKSLKVASHSADRICGILEQHGCDTVLEKKASTFFGIFSWSEVGLSYFVTSTAVLLLFPGAIGWLALVNLCCLPFTVWSIWYQRFRIHTWCTLCVTTQCLLWLQAGSYLWSGAWHTAWPLGPGIVPLAAAYVAALFGLNRLMTFIKRRTAGAPQSTSMPAQQQ